MTNLFDDWSRIAASRLPRRDAIKLILGGVAGTYLGLIWPGSASAQQVVCEEVTHPASPPLNPNPVPNPNCQRQGSTICANQGDGTRCCCTGNRTCCGGGGTGVTQCCEPNTQRCVNGKCCAIATGQPSAVRSGPPVQIDITCWSAAGISTMSVYKAVNASVDIPYYHPGTTDPVVVTATKLDPSQASMVQIELCPTDPCNCPECCQVVDPVLTTLRIDNEKNRTRESFTDIPAAEHFVTIQNGHPGLRKFHVLVNGQRAAYLRVGPKEVQTFDFAAAMTASRNTITLTGQGRPGASALVVIADAPWQGAKDARGNSLIEWEPGTAEEGVNMRWGGGEADVM